MPYSYALGKPEIQAWIYRNFTEGQTCLDVGPGQGTYADLMCGYLTMDACEIFEPNVKIYGLKEKYRRIAVCDIADFKYEWYDLVIFGDVIEHMTVEKAQEVLAYARAHSKDQLIAVPWKLPQGAVDGNEYERHIQDDLTEEIFGERYEGYEPIWVNHLYGYYHRKL